MSPSAWRPAAAADDDPEAAFPVVRPLPIAPLLAASSSSELARRVRLLLMCRARPSVSSSRAAIHVFVPFPLSAKTFRGASLFILTHCPAFLARAALTHGRGSRTASYIHTDTRQRDVGASTSYYSDTMSCEERTAVRCTDSVELGSTDDDVTRRRDTTAPRQKFD